MSCESPLKPCPICETDQIRHERTLNGIELLRCISCNLVYANMSDERIMEVNSGYDEELAAMYETEDDREAEQPGAEEPAQPAMT